MLETTLTLSALYLAAVGVGLIFFPLAFGVGAMPPDASPELMSLLRPLGGPFPGIVALNWLSRSGWRAQAELSTASGIHNRTVDNWSLTHNSKPYG